jgi:predicted lipoprotein with Yx(FWY)xxD motif
VVGSDRRETDVIRLLTVAAVLAGFAFAGCGGDDDDESSGAGAAAETTEATTTAEQAATEEPGGGQPGIPIKTASSQFGPVLFDGDDQAIYYFDKETGSRSQCYDACAEAWPPVLTKGEPRASGGADASLLGTTERDDGTTQVTYDGHPLYYYAHEGPGELKCHNVDEFGGLWLAVQPNGQAVPS